MINTLQAYLKHVRNSKRKDQNPLETGSAQVLTEIFSLSQPTPASSGRQSQKLFVPTSVWESSGSRVMFLKWNLTLRRWWSACAQMPSVIQSLHLSWKGEGRITKSAPNPDASLALKGHKPSFVCLLKFVRRSCRILQCQGQMFRSSARDLMLKSCWAARPTTSALKRQFVIKFWWNGSISSIRPSSSLFLSQLRTAILKSFTLSTVSSVNKVKHFAAQLISIKIMSSCLLVALISIFGYIYAYIVLVAF